MYRLQAAAKQLRLHKDVAHALDTYGNVSNGKLWETPDSKSMKHCCDCKGKKQWRYWMVKSEDSSVHSLPLIAGVSGLAAWLVSSSSDLGTSSPDIKQFLTVHDTRPDEDSSLVFSCSLSQLVVEIIKWVHYTILWGLACEIKKYIFSTFYILHG